MGRALFSQQSFASPAIHEETGYATENPVEKAAYERWSIANPFDPDSDEFFSNAQTERFLEPEELTERQVIISSDVPPSDTDPSMSLPDAGPPVSNWVSVGPNTWARTVRRAHPPPVVMNVPSQMRPLESPDSSEASTPRSASPQTPNPVYSPTLPGLIPTEDFIASLPPPATSTTIMPTIPSLTSTVPHRQHESTQMHSRPQLSSPPPSVSSRAYNWTRARHEEVDTQHSTSRRTRPRLDTGAGASVPSSSRHPRRVRTRSLGTPHQQLESLIPGYGSWHERHPHIGLRAPSTNNNAVGHLASEDSGRVGGRERVGLLDDDATVALLRRLLERSERARDYVRDLDNHLESMSRRRGGLLPDGAMDFNAIQTEEGPEPEPFIPEPEALSFAAL